MKPSGVVKVSPSAGIQLSEGVQSTTLWKECCSTKTYRIP